MINYFEKNHMDYPSSPSSQPLKGLMLLFFISFIIITIFLILITHNYAMEKFQLEAVRHQAAEWKTDPTTGKTYFSWKKLNK